MAEREAGRGRKGRAGNPHGMPYEAVGGAGPDHSSTFAGDHGGPEKRRVHCEGEDLEIPVPSSLDELRDNPDYEGGQWVFVDVDPGALDTRKERINLSVPAYALLEIDAYTCRPTAMKPYMKMSSHAVLTKSNQSAFVTHLDS